MRRILLLVTVALIGLIAGAVVTGRPQTVTRDVRAVDIRPTTSTIAATTIPRTTAVPTTTSSTTTTTSTSTTAPTTTELEPTTTEAPVTTEAPATTDAPATDAPTTLPRTTAPASSAPATPAPTTTTLMPINSLYIMVGNASNTFGLATQTAAALRDLGYELVYRADGIREMRQTAVYFSDGLEAEAQRLAESIGLDSSRVEARPSEPLTSGTQEFEILLLLGNDWHTVTALTSMVDVQPPDAELGLLETPRIR